MAGCTTVSAPPPTVPAAPRRAPDVVRLTPSAAPPLLATAQPDPVERTADAAVPAPAGTRPPLRGTTVIVPLPARPLRHRLPRTKVPRVGRMPRTEMPRVGRMPADPRAARACALGRAYGHWAVGGSASTICSQVYERR